ncbi:unnamed protein product [Periconia digitata]|uniref:Uncharacterized protein n=1 Tax=Periconia digitata TaxID=1303443 RepID=A0A9W4XJ20_9PLEO|nr:unnamed protein product [Periconia digitata]
MLFLSLDGEVGCCQWPCVRKSKYIFCLGRCDMQNYAVRFKMLAGTYVGAIHRSFVLSLFRRFNPPRHVKSTPVHTNSLSHLKSLKIPLSQFFP